MGGRTFLPSKLVPNIFHFLAGKLVEATFEQAGF